MAAKKTCPPMPIAAPTEWFFVEYCRYGQPDDRPNGYPPEQTSYATLSAEVAAMGWEVARAYAVGVLATQLGILPPKFTSEVTILKVFADGRISQAQPELWLETARPMGYFWAVMHHENVREYSKVLTALWESQ